MNMEKPGVFHGKDQPDRQRKRIDQRGVEQQYQTVFRTNDKALFWVG